MHVKRGSKALLLGWVCLVLGCSSKPAEEKALADNAMPLAMVGWEGTGSMAEARKLHAAGVLPSGKVLVTGGSRGATYLASATVYEPVTGQWTVVAPMPQARQAHTLTVLNTGKVLVAGGESSGFLASTAVYDPATNTWASAGNFATGVGRGYMTATELPDGRVMVAGGLSNGPHGRVDVYDPAAGTWAVGPTMRTPRRSHTATLLQSGKVLVVGGWSGGATGTVELYDPAANTWSTAGALLTARYDHTATLLDTGKVLVVGGRNSAGVVASAELYDPATGVWSATGAPGTAREQHTATLLSTGKVLVAGGRNGSALASTEVYEEASGQWSTVQPMASARYQHVAVPLEALGKVLVVGGVGLATAELYAYDACAGVSCTTAPGPCFEAAGTCGNGVCSYAPKASGSSCDDGNPCTGADVCNGAGACAGSATQCSTPPGQCYAAAGTCSGGACDYAYKAAGAACDDRDACTVGEVCNGAGGCAGTPVSCNSPPGQCYEAAGRCSSGACSYAPKAAGSACNDGNAGTLNDVCNGAGSCAGVVACTTPPSACHHSPGTYSNGACTYLLKAEGTACGAGRVCNATGQCQSGCWIAGAYYAAGAPNPGNPCQQCSPSVSTSSWSNKASGDTCGTPSYSNCSECDNANACDDSGTRSCTATHYVCSSGTCQAAYSVPATIECWRNTEGAPCNTYRYCEPCGDFSGTCDETGTKDCEVMNFACSNGACHYSGTTYETGVECWRNTTDNVCDFFSSCSECSFASDCATQGTKSCTRAEVHCGEGICKMSPVYYIPFSAECERPTPPSCPPLRKE
ncbi:MAG TPA: kelch repeat-containing protein [Myxococcaceae bacterium]|jgi:hypothetical protein